MPEQHLLSSLQSDPSTEAYALYLFVNEGSIYLTFIPSSIYLARLSPNPFLTVEPRPRPPAQSRANSPGEFALEDVVSQQRTRGRPDWKELRGPQRHLLFGEVFRSGCLADFGRFRIWGSRFLPLIFLAAYLHPPLGLLSFRFSPL